MVEIIVVVAVISILVAILAPVLTKHVKDAMVARTYNETLVISTAILSLHKDTGMWPFTNLNGPSGAVDRIVGDPLHVPKGTTPDANPGAENWGKMGTPKPIYDYLFYNNPDDNTGPENQNEPGQDYPRRGRNAWRGPYLDVDILADPWGFSYVVNARYFPGNPNAGILAYNHRVFVLSAGPDGMWTTAFHDNINRFTNPNDAPAGDDIGCVITTNSRY